MRALLCLLLVMAPAISAIASAQPLPVGPSSHACAANLLKIRLADLSANGRRKSLRELVRDISKSPEWYAPIFEIDESLAITLAWNVFQHADPAFQREIHQMLAAVPTQKFNDLLDWLKVSYLPEAAQKPIDPGLTAPFHQLSDVQRLQLDALMSGMTYSATNITRRIRQLTASQPTFSPLQKQTLAINLVERCNSYDSCNYALHKFLEPSPQGDYFLCSAGCTYVLVFGADNKVYAGNYIGMVRDFDSAKWRDLIFKRYLVKP